MKQLRSSFSFPTDIRFGSGVSDELADYVLSQKLMNPLVVTDKIVSELSFFTSIVKQLEKKGLSVVVYNEMHKNPVKSDVDNGGNVYHEYNRDCIIGIGGGVAMDVARAIALRVYHNEDLFYYDDLIGGDQYVTGKIPHLITLPTTSGTGSEVGRSAIISEDDTKKKRILFSPRLMAKKVFADPELTMDLPPFITAATGMDALTHNMEAYLAKNYNPMCSGIALEGMKLIFGSIVNATHKPDIEARSDMMMGSLMGAVAFQKGLGIVHSLAHPLSSLLDTHHGLANAINLPFGMEFNYTGFETLFDNMAYSAGLGKNKGHEMVPFLHQLGRELGLPGNLSEIGVRADHIETLSQLALEDFCHPNNPKPVTRENFASIYLKAL